MPPTTQRAVNNMLMGALFRRAHSASPAKSIKVNYGNIAQLQKQSMSISKKVSLAGNEYNALQKALTGAARSSLAQRSVKIRSEFSQLQSLYSRQNMALQTAQSSYRGTETKATNLWGRELPRSFNAFFRRAPTKSHSASPAKGVKISSGNSAQLEKQSLAIGAKVDEAWKEQQAFRKALAGAGWEGSARTAMDQLGRQIDVAFNQLHSLLHQPSPQGSYRATESKQKALWGRA